MFFPHSTAILLVNKQPAPALPTHPSAGDRDPRGSSAPSALKEDLAAPEPSHTMRWLIFYTWSIIVIISNHYSLLVDDDDDDDGGGDGGDGDGDVPQMFNLSCGSITIFCGK